MSEMKHILQLRKTCRGMGKIYALVDIPEPLRTCRLMVRSEVEGGIEVPSTLLPYNEASRVLVLAVLDVVQTVTLTAIDDSGAQKAELKRAIRPKVAKLSSQVHTFLKDREMEKIRNYDAQRFFGEYGMDLTRVVLAPENVDVVQGEAMCTSDSHEYLETEMEVCFISRTGENAALTKTTILRDYIVDVPRSGGCATRTVQFSARIPRSLNAFIVWFRPKDRTLSAPNGFYALEPHALEWWRRMWGEWTGPAMIDQRYTDRFDLDWVASQTDLEIQRRTPLTVSPKFSIIVPLFNTPLEYLDDMMESVVGQSYANFELVLVNASPENKDLVNAVSAWRLRDDRIVVVSLDGNRGITENTNAGILAATGDFLCFLDHDDTLTLDALFWYAKALEDYPETDLFYSDEDHLDNGSYTHPYFKPDWEPDLLLGMNYVCHFLAVRKSIVDGMELPTHELDGAQDHNMALYVSERARNIYHCRRVLYHWRVHPGSTADNIDKKPYAVEAGRLAVQKHLDRCGIKARAIHSPRATNRYEVIYDLGEEPLVSILIPNKDAVPVLDNCLRSIREKTDYPNYEVIIVENNSTDDKTFAYYKKAEREDSRVRVVYYDGNFNYAKINNFGASYVKGEYLLMLNNDTEVIDPGWMRRMVSVCARESTGIVGVKLLYADHTVQHAGVISNTIGPCHANMYRENSEIGPSDTLWLMQDVSAVTGACLMVKKRLFDEVGGMDPQFEVDYNDVDFCWQVKALGYLIVYDPMVELYHYESVSRGFHPTTESALRFEREKGLLRIKWPQYYAIADKMGNPNYDQGNSYYRLGTAAYSPYR